jgi:hypothetical protein
MRIKKLFFNSKIVRMLVWFNKIKIKIITKIFLWIILNLNIK